MIARFLIAALLAMTAACAKPRPMDWAGLADYLEQQERK